LESGKLGPAGGPDVRRKLAVIQAADVAGYSRLVAADEEGTVRRFRQAAAAIGERVQKYRARVFSIAGDAILAEFESTVDAIPDYAQNAAIDPSRS
jgi:adenylate cyclase